MAKKKTLQDFYTDLVLHQAEDKLQFAQLHQRLDNMATKEDTKQIMEAIRTWKIGLGIFKVSGSTIMWVGGVITALALITGAGQSAWMWLIGNRT